MANKLLIKKTPQLEVLNSDLVLEVYVAEDKLGELHISKGSFDFYKKGAKKSFRRLSWSKLAELMEEHGEAKP